ncbi:MAG: STAS/SEC14 domain-containing protein [Anaerolineae bacterium]|nr:STAS/SEC14 domain-containing protein [Anaerolineae bacterium]
MKIYDSGDRLIGVKIDSTLTKADYQRLIPLLEERIDKFDKLKVLIQFEEFDGIEPGALLEEFKFDSKHRDDFDKVAIVGHKRWQEWLANISEIFFDTDIKYFGSDEVHAAWRWLGAREKLRQFDVNDEIDKETASA